jgi:hypothetical protein
MVRWSSGQRVRAAFRLQPLDGVLEDRPQSADVVGQGVPRLAPLFPQQGG